MATHSMCQPGRPGPHGEGQVGSLGLADFQRAKSSGSSLNSSTSTRAPEPLPRVRRSCGVRGRRIPARNAPADIHRIRSRVGRSVAYEGLDERNHFVDEFGGVWSVVGMQNVEFVHHFDVDRLPSFGHLRFGEAFRVGPVDDVVVDIGDVGDVMDLDASPFEVAAGRRR